MNRLAKILLLAAVLVLCGGAVLFQKRSDRARQAIAPNQLYAVVWKQISAFRSEDFAAAYRQASTGFQEKVNIDAFSDLARTSYPDLIRATRVEFGAVHLDGRRAVIPAYFFLPEGDVIPCIYSLIREDDAWKIDRARVLRRWPAGRRLGGMRS